MHICFLLTRKISFNTLGIALNGSFADSQEFFFSDCLELKLNSQTALVWMFNYIGCIARFVYDAGISGG